MSMWDEKIHKATQMYNLLILMVCYEHNISYIYIHTCLLLLISILWHRQAIFESKGDKLSTYVRTYVHACVCTYIRTYMHTYIHTYMFVVNFDALAQTSDFRIEMRQFAFLVIPGFEPMCLWNPLSSRLNDLWHKEVISNRKGTNCFPLVRPGFEAGHFNVNSLRPRPNRRHFADDIFKWIFFNENIWILIKISLKFVSKGPINNIPALVQIMAWRRPGDKPLSERMMLSSLTHICVTRPQWVKAKGTMESQVKHYGEKPQRAVEMLCTFGSYPNGWSNDLLVSSCCNFCGPKNYVLSMHWLRLSKYDKIPVFHCKSCKNFEILKY